METAAVHPSLSYINCLLLKYISGCSIASLRPGITITNEEAEHVSQRVLELGRQLRRYGVNHSDIHGDNIILRAEDNSPVLIDWGRANFMLLTPLKDDTNYADYHKGLQNLLRDGVYYEGPNEDPVYPSYSAGGVCHRLRTPLSDEEQMRIAREDGTFQWVNKDIASLTKEEKDFFYDEDTSVDDS